MSSLPYSPPYDIGEKTLKLVVSIVEQIARLGLTEGAPSPPQLRRENRIKSIHASLAIENNTLSLEQVTALLAGKRVLGPLREVQEVKNTFAAYLPVEDVIRRDQDGYYKALAAADGMGKSNPFIQFMLNALLKALEETAFTDQVSDQVKALLLCLADQTLAARECMGRLGLSHRPTFGKNYLKAALDVGLIERSIPKKTE